MPGAWESFVDRFIGMFIHVINHTARSRSVPLGREDVDDLCSEVFVTLLDRDFAVLRGFRGESSLATYLTVVARRVVVHAIVRKRRSEAMGHVDAHQASLDSTGGRSPELDRIEDADEVQAILGELDYPERDVFRLFHLEGRSYRQISAELGVPENSIGPMLSRSREKLRHQKEKVRASS
ncbi:MAG: sigma-70 family RNA polymerase sigma factor [Planctomycetaceae bacterium]